MNKRLIIQFFTLILLSSCEKAIDDLNIPFHENKLVVYSFLSPNDTTIKAHITFSQHVLDDRYLSKENDALWYSGFPFVNNASVQVYQNDTLLTELLNKIDSSYGDYNYISDRVEIASGSSYTLQVNAPGYPEVTATTHIPNPSGELTHIQAIKSFNLDGFDSDRVEFFVSDNETDLNNFYSVIVRNRGSYPAQTVYENVIWTGSEAIFTDSHFVTGENEKKGNVEIFSFGWTDSPTSISFRNISEEMYNFLRDIALEEKNQESDLFPSEPIETYSNVTGGYGVVGGYTEKFLQYDPTTGTLEIEENPNYH